jgi:hypothetical protein
MALLTVQTCNASAGLAPTLIPAGASGDTFANTGNEVLMVKNGGATEITVTIVSAVKCNQGFSHDLAVTVSAGAEKLIGSFNPARFNTSDGIASITYSASTSVTVGVIRVD